MKDDPPPNRFSAVIEKIERLYTVCYTLVHTCYCLFACSSRCKVLIDVHENIGRCNWHFIC